MFLGSKLINTLMHDHANIKQYLDVLLDKNSKISDLKESFYSLLPELRSHNRREEKIVYRYMHNKSDLKFSALEGQEEHHVVDILLKDLDTHGAELEDERWRAKTTVLAKLIQNHLEQEEEDTFLNLRKYLTAKSDALLCQKYENKNFSDKDSHNGQNAYV